MKRKRRSLADCVKFEDCLTCRHLMSDLCDDCEAGEHFEFENESDEPTPSELMAMARNHDDEV